MTYYLVGKGDGGTTPVQPSIAEQPTTIIEETGADESEPGDQVALLNQSQWLGEV